MLVKETDKVLAAFARLSMSQDYQTVLEYLENSLKETDKAIRRASGEALTREQGMSLMLEAIIDLSRNAIKQINSRKD